MQKSCEEGKSKKCTYSLKLIFILVQCPLCISEGNVFVCLLLNIEDLGRPGGQLSVILQNEEDNLADLTFIAPLLGFETNKRWHFCLETLDKCKCCKNVQISLKDITNL